jgi:predicted nuclease with TOPRIM domain
LPKKISDEKKDRQQKIEKLEKENTALNSKIDTKSEELEDKMTTACTELEARLDAKINEKFNDLSSRTTCVEEAVSHYPEYRAQSLQIQTQLQQSDKNILEVCDAIKSIGEKLNTRLEDLERREKNSLRAKILNEYRLYTDTHKNPQQAWTEMEHHSFFKLVEDYESLGGNDYVHSVVLPAMNELDVIPMTQLTKIKALYDSRNVK